MQKIRLYLIISFALVANLVFSQAVQAGGCGLRADAIDHQSIIVHYDAENCKRVKKKGVKLCLKKRNAAHGACNGGTVRYTGDSEGSIIFSGLKQNTEYKIKGLYKKNVWWSGWRWRKFDKIWQKTPKKSLVCTEQTTDLTSNVKTVRASGMYSSSYAPWKAFDEYPSPSMWISAIWETPAWISYQWSSPRLINKYSITYKNGSITTRAPKDWTLQGWNGYFWVTVDSRSNQTNWAGTETRSYTVASPGSYSKYQLHFTDDNDNRHGIVVISIGNISLQECK